MIKISSLVELVMKDPFLKLPITQLRNKLIECVVSYNEYKIIFNRKIYYEHMDPGDANSSKYIDIQMDHRIDTCFHCCCFCINTSPHPLYVNYIPLNLLNCEECLLTIKQKFGYSVRPTNFISYKNSSMKYMSAENRYSSHSFTSNKNSLVNCKVVKQISFKQNIRKSTKYTINPIPPMQSVITDSSTPV